jgi:hypothetical protein
MEEDGRLTVTLTAPQFFDQTIGYWTGEPDRDLLARALAEVPQDPTVEREMADGSITLRGPREAVLSEATALRDAGLQ